MDSGAARSAQYAHDLYANLRTLDAAGCDALLVEQLPPGPEWAAVNDRLMRAAAGSAVPDERSRIKKKTPPGAGFSLQ